MCMVEVKEDGSFVQICNCKNGSSNCGGGSKRRWFFCTDM
jgi:hypothetical protein